MANRKNAVTLTGAQAHKLLLRVISFGSG